jgi:hypothetical protein
MIYQNVFSTRCISTRFIGFYGPKITQKKIWKQNISTILDKGYRFMYELSYHVEKNFWAKVYLASPIHPSKGDSPYSPFHSTFLRVNHPSRRLN